jgi:tetratricopeptide (TPR) repeat protein
MVPAVERKATVKRKYALALASSIAALTLAACGTMPAMTTMEAAATQDAPPPGNTVAGRYLAAKFAASAGDVKGAAAFYAETLKEDPNNRDLLVRTFMFAAESGDIEQAIALADRVIAADPENRPARLIRQAGAFMKKDYIAVAKDADPSSQGAFTLLTNNVVSAWAIAGSGEIDGALAMLDGLITQRGVDGLRLMHKALILDYAGRDQDADATYREALSIMGMGPRISDAYGRFLARKGRSEEAKTLYSRVLMENPGHPVAVQSIRDIDAKRSFQPLVGTPAEGVAEALFGIAASLNDRRSSEVAILYLNITLYLRPNFDLARVLLASHYERMQNFEMANSFYARIPQSSPYYAMTLIQAAINDGRMDRHEAGVTKLKALVDRGTADPDAWTALGDLLRASDRFAEAVPAYDKAIAGLKDDDRRLVQIYYARGVSLERSNRWDEAERDFRQALRMNPERADVLNYLGYSFVDKGINLQEAVTMLEKARALRPLDGMIADSVGWAYYKLGRYQEAARTLEEAVQLAPGASDINDHLGDAYWRIGRRIDARFQWQHALALDPDQSQKEIIERKIQFGLDSVSASGQ